MFTGLIEDIGTVRELRRAAAGARMTIATAIPVAELTMGESIAVNGACLTVVAFGGDCFAADLTDRALHVVEEGLCPLLQHPADAFEKLADLALVIRLASPEGERRPQGFADLLQQFLQRAT